jgi:hypothetical protein
MNVIASLILGHLIADFPLQTARIFHWKMKSLKGAFIHSGVHLLVNLVLFYPSFYKVWWALLFLFFIHAFQDHLKVRMGGERINTPTPFLLDQFFHFLILGLASLLPPFRALPATALNAATAIRLSGLIAATFVWTILNYVAAQSMPKERRDLAINLTRKSVDFLINGLFFGSIVTGCYVAVVPVFLAKALLWKYEVGESYYSSFLELVASPAWAVLLGAAVRFVGNA